jgi:hypothetical protein
MRQYIIKACSFSNNRCGPYLTLAGVTTLELQIYGRDHSSSFPFSILHFPLIAPSGLQLCQHLDHLAKST